VRILLSNDDGVQAAGIHHFADELRALGQVVICAPEEPKSGASSALTIYRPLIVHRLRKDVWSVSGNPADAVKLALTEILDGRPDLVVSGINNGLNTGSNVLYSGTVAAALEGAQAGITSFAVSRKVSPVEDYRAEAKLATTLIGRLAKVHRKTGTTFNINIPAGKPKGIRVTATELTPYVDRYDRRTDPRGRTYFWLRGTPPRVLAKNGRTTDDWAIARGFITVTPLRRDLTDGDLLEDLSRLLG